ncbi:S9 family peptidase [Aliikangiella sp. IMCC44359]|uniref:S9 family peptidase n=1 Tax=Aliikangiella sp. IMCC44359 TaxID=3459125 RepID=UPI00403AF7B0
MKIEPPKAKKIAHKLKAHQHERNDNYYWLRDDNRSNSEVLDYLNAENQYAQEILAPTKKLQNELYHEMISRLEADKTFVAYFNKGYWYNSKFEKGKDYEIHFRQKNTLEAPEEVLLDENLRAENKDFYELESLILSPNQQLIGIAEDLVSRRQYDIRFKNLTTDNFFPEVIHNTSGSLAWANDNKTIFYVKNNPVTLQPYQVYRHQLGSSPETDILIYEEKDSSFYLDIYKTRSEKYIAIAIESTTSDEVRLINADIPNNEPQLFLAREKNHKYNVEHLGKDFYVSTDFNAPNKKLVKVKDSQIGTKDNWVEIIPHNEDSLIQEFELFNQHMVVNERINGLEKLIVRDIEGRFIHEVKFNDTAYTTRLGHNPDKMSQKIRYHYSSLTTPNSIYEYDLTNKSYTLLKQDKLIGNFNSSNYKTERIMITARDGKSVPVSIVYRKNQFKSKGENPLLIYAYGSYGTTIDPYFSSSRLSLLDRGFIYAIAHIRGGQMLGRQWYEDGKKLTKMNTFTDYIDVTKALINLGYADPKRVYAEGRSAGGLLMGSIANLAPELYHGIITEVPFVDVITTMLDESIPLTTLEYDEWGNPNDKKFYDYMLSYSPYDQIKQQNYPHIMVNTGLYDSQVQYWEPAKWVAKLRELKTDNNLLILNTDMESGHGGKSGRYKKFIEQAQKYSFLLYLADINK